MKSVFRVLAIVVAVVVLGVGLVAGAARLSDGPIGPFAGGGLESGSLTPSVGVDWTFLRDVGTIEFQLLEPPRSRTVWVAVIDGERTSRVARRASGS